MEHKKIDLGNIHKPHNWEFADATARAAAVIADSDLIGALALQLDDGTYWRLTSVGPTVWTKAATPNASDAELRDRSTHTGTQAISSVTGLQTALDAAASHTTNTSNPHSVTKAQVGLGNVENKSSADIRSEISSGNVTTALGYTPLAPSAVGDTVASLVAGKVPSSQLPAYVDDVLEYANLAGFPATGTAGIIYVALDTNKTYRWSGSAYTEISPSPGSTDSVTEGSSNLYFTAARVRDAVLTGLTTVSSAVIAASDSVIGAFQKLQAQITAHTTNTSNPHSVTKAQVGLGSADNTSDADKPISTATQTALDAKFDKAGGTVSGPVTFNGFCQSNDNHAINNGKRHYFYEPGTTTWMSVYSPSAGVLRVANAGGALLDIGATALLPGSDNTYNAGSGSYAIKQIYSNNSLIVVSDARLKTTRPYSVAERAVAQRIKALGLVYQWNDAIAAKGADKARLHFGVTVQSVIAAFEAEGLDPFRYGVVCYDEWEAEVVHHPAVEAREAMPARPVEYETREACETVIVNGQETELVRTYWHEVSPATPAQEAVQAQPERTETIREAGNRYSLRLDQLAFFIATAGA